MNNHVLSCQHLTKSFRDAGEELQVLNNIEFTASPNQLIAIVGVSGSGKSTLLHLLGGLDTPTQGVVYWNDQDIQKLSEKRRCHLRNHHLGFVYQFHYLLPEFTALENVAMPVLIGGGTILQAKETAEELLVEMGLADRMHHKSAELSGGERQRVAIARALATRPACILADEPTGNLDAKTADNVMQSMFKLQKQLGTSFIIVTHDMRCAEQMDMSYKLENGLICPL